MTIFVPGIRCVLCNKTISSSKESTAFSPFIANQLDALFVFSDAIVHTSCFTAHPLADEARRWHTTALHQQLPMNRICTVCGELITDPDDYFGTGLLSRVENEPLFPYNFIHLHITHAHQWPILRDFVREISTAKSKGQWAGPSIVTGESHKNKFIRWSTS